MRTIIEYMQLCHIHFCQKIARKKVARVNAAYETLHITTPSHNEELVSYIAGQTQVRKVEAKNLSHILNYYDKKVLILMKISATM